VSPFPRSVVNPDVVVAVDELVGRGVLDGRAAVRLRRAASGSHVSVNDELRGLLWVGVFLITTGVGILIRHNLDRLGPVAIAAGLGVAAAACLGWAFRRQAARGFAFDSILLLGALLAAADLAFVEVKFTPLGEHWPWHLLIVASAFAALAFRFDSKSLFSLALTSFAAWRGVAIAGVATPWGGVVDDSRLLVEALACGLLFIAVGKLLERLRVRASFEPVAAWLGWLLIVGALAMRLCVDESRTITAAALLGCGAVLAWFAWDDHSVGRYALGVGAAAIGIGGWAAQALEAIGGGAVGFLTVILAIASVVIVLVLRAHRALGGPS
jgi:hypothetical protein